MPGLMMGRKKSVAGRACKARWDFHDHRGQAAGEGASCMADRSNLKHPSETVAAYPAARRGVPKPMPPGPSTTQNRQKPPTMARRKVGVSSVHEPPSNQRPNLPFPKPPPADPRARRIQSGQHCRPCRRVLLATARREPHLHILTLAAGSWQQPILLLWSTVPGLAD